MLLFLNLFNSMKTWAVIIEFEGEDAEQVAKDYVNVLANAVDSGEMEIPSPITVIVDKQADVSAISDTQLEESNGKERQTNADGEGPIITVG
jgi:hypothetical protein